MLIHFTIRYLKIFKIGSQNFLYKFLKLKLSLLFIISLAVFLRFISLKKLFSYHFFKIKFTNLCGNIVGIKTWTLFMALFL